MYQPDCIYSLADAQDLALSPFDSLSCLVELHNPHYAVVMHTLKRQILYNILEIGKGMQGRCNHPAELVFNGFCWQNVRCLRCSTPCR